MEFFTGTPDATMADAGLDLLADATGLLPDNSNNLLSLDFLNPSQLLTPLLDSDLLETANDFTDPVLEPVVDSVFGPVVELFVDTVVDSVVDSLSSSTEDETSGSGLFDWLTGLSF